MKQCTPDLLAQAMDAEVTKGTCAEIEDALEKVKRGEMSREDFETFKGEHKKRLPIITPHAMFPKGRRCNGDAVASGLSMYDIDHISDPRGYYQTMVADRVAELGIVLAHVTPSLEGLRLIFVMPQGMTLEEAQLWMSQQLGDANYDGCVKDMARSSFVVPRSYVLYMDEEELFNANVNVNGNETAQAPTKREQARYENEDNKNASKAESSPCTGGTKGSLSFKGIPYSEIIAEYWKRTGGEPEEGERNVKLHKLAANLRSICDNRQEVLMQVMPRLGLSEQELQGIINSACKEPAKGSKVMDSIVESMTNDNVNGNDSSLFIPRSSLKKMPLGLKESLVGVPKPMQMPVLCAVMPIAAAYADQVEVEYCD
ncbi:MAG: VirE protein, partial [Prevotella sp.]|nr:VirE protein [Prevotella sp.]